MRPMGSLLPIAVHATDMAGEADPMDEGRETRSGSRRIAADFGGIRLRLLPPYVLTRRFDPSIVGRWTSAFLVLLSLLVVLGLAAPVHAEIPIPKLQSRVTDLTNTLSAEQRQALETRLAEFESRKGAQIAVLLVPTTQPETVEQYARRVLDEWKLGRKGIDDGALLLIAMQDRKLRIETQYGLEGPLPDATAKRIVDEIIVPRFKQKDFYGGISSGIERMIAVVDGEPLPPPQPKAQQRSDDFDVGGLLMLGFALVFVVGTVLRRMIGRVGGAAATAGIGGAISWLVIGTAIAAGTVAVLLFVLSLFINFSGLSRTGGSRSGGWGPTLGGGWSGGGSWGGGGGGWSGGGGLGGGGGASGDW
jgi:uncharacterized protein